MPQGVLHGFRNLLGYVGRDRISVSSASGGVSEGSKRADGAASLLETAAGTELSADQADALRQELLRKKQEAAQPTTTALCQDPDPESEDIRTANSRSYIDDLQNFID